MPPLVSIGLSTPALPSYCPLLVSVHVQEVVAGYEAADH